MKKKYNAGKKRDRQTKTEMRGYCGLEAGVGLEFWSLFQEESGQTLGFYELI